MKKIVLMVFVIFISVAQAGIWSIINPQMATATNVITSRLNIQMSDINAKIQQANQTSSEIAELYELKKSLSDDLMIIKNDENRLWHEIDAILNKKIQQRKGIQE